MNKAQADSVLKLAQTIAASAADICDDGERRINNQVTLSSLMLATCIMARFFNEDKELVRRLLEAMLAAVDEMPCSEEFDDFKIH